MKTLLTQINPTEISYTDNFTKLAIKQWNNRTMVSGNFSFFFART